MAGASESTVTTGASDDRSIRVIGIDNPPVNSLSRAVRAGLAKAIAVANSDPTVKAIVLIGVGKTFSAGADITEFASPSAVEDLHLADLIGQVESSPKPVIAAVQGVALGGGLELALGCHFRVARADAKVALPEIKLGLIPGAGGTQRLPRAIELSRALDLITSGRIVAVSDAAVQGLFDEIVSGDLEAATVAFARHVIDEALLLRRLSRQSVIGSDPTADIARARGRLRGNPGELATAKAIESIEAAAARSFEEGMKLERRLFGELMTSPQSHAMRHAFFAEREAAKIPDVPAGTPTRDVRQVALVGAGTMGSGISLAFLNAGFAVTLIDTGQEAVDRALGRIHGTYDQSVAKGMLSAADKSGRLARLVTSTDLGAAAKADLVIEAVFEDMAVKSQVLAGLDAVVRSEAILATNTSTLDVNRLAAATAMPERVVGMHFFSPANIMRLVEVVRGTKTSKEMLATAMRVVRQLGKVGVVSGVCDGFIGNRMVEEYLRQAYFLLDEGALPQQVDGALERWGMAMGPLRMMDLAGNDIGLAIRKRRRLEQPDRPYSLIPDRICELGRFGQKTGAGFYRYEAGNRAALPDPVIEKLIVAYSREIGLERRAIPDDEIVQRCIYALINEGARILEEGIALRASDIDVVYLAGYGFPAYRGGPMFYANEVGLANIERTMADFAKGYHGEFWQPAPLLQRLASENGRFNAPTTSSGKAKTQ